MPNPRNPFALLGRAATPDSLWARWFGRGQSAAPPPEMPADLNNDSGRAPGFGMLGPAALRGIAGAAAPGSTFERMTGMNQMQRPGARPTTGQGSDIALPPDEPMPGPSGPRLPPSRAIAKRLALAQMFTGPQQDAGPQMPPPEIEDPGIDAASSAIGLEGPDAMPLESSDPLQSMQAQMPEEAAAPMLPDPQKHHMLMSVLRRLAGRR